MCFHFEQCFSNIFPVETTRYSNPLKQKFRAKRMAAESSYLIFFFFLGSDSCIPISSGRRRCDTCPETAQRTNARRIPAAQQDSLPAEPAGKRHKGSTHVLVLSVCILLSLLNSPSYLLTCRFPDTPIYTKCVSSLRSEILRSWNIWTKEVQEWPKMHCTIISLMERIRSRCSFLWLSGCHELIPLQITFARK